MYCTQLKVWGTWKATQTLCLGSWCCGQSHPLASATSLVLSCLFVVVFWFKMSFSSRLNLHSLFFNHLSHKTYSRGSKPSFFMQYIGSWLSRCIMSVKTNVLIILHLFSRWPLSRLRRSRHVSTCFMGVCLLSLQWLPLSVPASWCECGDLDRL